ncbi:MAG: BamA/TamA family outer membrane protein [Planctomycetota bacterium]
MTPRPGRRAGAALALLLAPGLDAQSGDATTRRIREVQISSRNVFPEDDDDRWFYAAFNTLHVPTAERVIRRELWFDEGDAIDGATVAELERNLRRLGLFGEVSAQLVDTGDTADEADLVIDTRDRFSLIAAAGGGFVGGVSGVGVLLSESNFLGLGKRFTASYNRNDAGETSLGIGYFDPQLFGSWHQLDARVGETEEGPFFALAIERPIKHLRDPLSYGFSGSYEERNVDYFERGESVAELPQQGVTAGGFLARVYGPRHLRARIGLTANAALTEYGAARGVSAAQIRVPGDTTAVSAGPFARIDWADSFLKVRNLDALDYDEDVRLGLTAELGLSGVLRDETGRDARLQPAASARFLAAARPLPDTFVTMDVTGAARWYRGDLQGWTAAAALHGYQLSLPAQTLAASISFDAVFEVEDREPQLTLGEDNGLRGYPAREFAGARRVRLNIEDRIDTGLEAFSFHLGLAAFFDAGWVHSGAQSLSQGEAIKSAGLGLRLGSSEVLGNNVIRLDLAWPLDEVNGNEYDLSLSFSAGQVFRFFGNSSELRNEF